MNSNNNCSVGYTNFTISNSSECGPSNHFVHQANYKGGASTGYVNFNTKFDTIVATGTNAFEWGTCTSLYNYSDGPDSENTAGYMQAWKYGKGKTWAGTIEMSEKQPNIEDNLGCVSLELDLFGYGGDKTQSQKTALDIVLGRTDNIDGSIQKNPQPLQPYAGIAIRPYDMLDGNFQGGTCILCDTENTDNSWDTGLKLNGNFNNSGIDLSGIQGTEQVIKLAGTQKIVFTGGKYGDVSLYVDEDSGLLTVSEGGTSGYISLLPFTKSNAVEKTMNLKSGKNKDKKDTLAIIAICFTVLNLLLLCYIIFKRKKE